MKYTHVTQVAIRQKKIINTMDMKQVHKIDIYETCIQSKTLLIFIGLFQTQN